MAKSAKIENAPTELTNPGINQSGWQEFVLSQFTQDELKEGRPTCDGLRRVFELLIGTIQNCIIKVVQAPNINNANHATVECRIDYLTLGDTGYSRSIQDVADSHDGNTLHPYNLYTTATAATIAEGRALRKGLRLKVVSSDEITHDVTLAVKNQSLLNEASMITDNQKSVINRLSGQLRIDLVKMLPKSIDLLTHEEAQQALRELNDYSRGPENGGKIVPEEIIKKGK